MARSRLLWLLAVSALLLASVAAGPGAAREPPRPLAAGDSCGSGDSLSSFSAYALTEGDRLLSRTEIPVCIRGKLTIEFHGDAPSGCATSGVCAYQGNESWRPDEPLPPGERVDSSPGDLDILAFSHHGRRAEQATLLASSLQPLTGRVTRTGSQTVCSDSVGDGPGFLSSEIVRGTLRVGFAASQPWIGTRCAGPLYADVLRALPVGRIALNAARHGRTTIPMALTRPFAAHGFAGTVSSTITLRLGRARTSTLGGTPSSRRRKVGHRAVTVSYRIAKVSGSIGARVRAPNSAAMCSRLDACGLSAMIRVAPHVARSGQSELNAIGPSRRPYRDFLAALGLSRTGNPHGIEVIPSFSWRDTGQTTAVVDHGGACRDSVRLTASALELGISRRRLTVRYAPTASSFDPLRTRCPGPVLGSHALAIGHASSALLGRRRLTLAIHTGIGFRDRAYQVHTASSLSVTLQRTGISQSVY